MTTMIPVWVGGVLTPIEKLEAHQRGLRYKAISVFLIDGHRALIQRRALKKYHTPACGRIPAAHIPIGRNPQQTAQQGA